MVVTETLVLTERNSALLTHKFCFNWIVLGSFLPLSFAVDTLPLTALDLGGNMGQWGPRDKQQSVACGSFSRAQSIQPKFPEISVKNSMDRFGPTRKVSKKTGPPFEVVLFSRSDRSDRKMTVPFDHSETFSCPVVTVRYILDAYCSKNGGPTCKCLSLQFLSQLL